MTPRGLLRLLVPPIVLVAWRRMYPLPAPTIAPAHRPAIHTVQAGPLRGGRLFVAAGMPSYRDMLSGVYDSFLFDAMPKHDLQAGLVLDVGSHIGYHALAFAALYPGSKVIAFEPNPVNLERATVNLSFDKELASRIELLGIALSNSNGTVTMNGSSNVEDQTSSGSYIDGASRPLDDAVYKKAGFHPFTVDCRRLDDLAAERLWGPIAIIKIDVEGSEHLVLTGGLGILKRDRPLLLIEVHSVVCMLELGRVLHPLGYELLLLHEDRASRCFIAARCDLAQ